MSVGSQDRSVDSRVQYDKEMIKGEKNTSVVDASVDLLVHYEVWRRKM